MTFDEFVEIALVMMIDQLRQGSCMDFQGVEQVCVALIRARAALRVFFSLNHCLTGCPNPIASARWYWYDLN